MLKLSWFKITDIIFSLFLSLSGKAVGAKMRYIKEILISCWSPLCFPTLDLRYNHKIWPSKGDFLRTCAPRPHLAATHDAWAYATASADSRYCSSVKLATAERICSYILSSRLTTHRFPVVAFPPTRNKIFNFMLPPAIPKYMARSLQVVCQHKRYKYWWLFSGSSCRFRQ